MIGLNNQMVCITDVLFHFVSHLTNVGHDAEVSSFGLNEITNVVTTVVRYSERGHLEVSDFDGLTLLYDANKGSRNLLRYTVVARNAYMDLMCSIDGNLVVIAE